MHKKPPIYYPYSVYLPAGIQRDIFINKNDMNDGLLTEEDKENYDRTTLFYDIFLSTDESKLICIGPPFLNIGQPCSVLQGKQEIKFAISYLHSRFSLVLIDITQITRRESPTLSMHFESFEIIFRIPSSQRYVTGKTDIMLSTLQKDDSSSLIKQWCIWHNRVHGVKRIIIYDNGSSANYSLQQLSLELRDQEAEILLVHWPFPYGPVNNSKNQYTQTGSLNHCRLFFGHLSQWVINLDIDEYLYFNSAISLREHLGNLAIKSHPIVYMDSYLIYADTENKKREPRFFDHCLRQPYRRFGICKKYIYQPQKTEGNFVHSALVSLSYLSSSSRIKYKYGELWDQAKERYHFIKKANFLFMKVLTLKESLFFFHLQDLKLFWKQESAMAAKARAHHKDAQLVRDNRLQETAKHAELMGK